VVETTELICIPPKDVDFFLPHVVQFIADALKRANSDLKPAHIIRKLKAGSSLLWIVWSKENKKILASVTTEICGINGDGRVLVITTHGGLTKVWDMYLPTMHAYARKENCSEIRIYGRLGWLRALFHFGYRPLWVALSRKVSDGD
jgi:hypothetical protein